MIEILRTLSTALLCMMASLLFGFISVSNSALAEDTIGPHPDGVFIECSSYRTDTTQRIDSSCIGYGFPSMRTYKVVWGSDCFTVTYRNGSVVSKERLSGERIVSETPGDCSTD